MIKYILTRTKRKSISVSVGKGAKVYVKAPIKVPISYIENFIISKYSWIEKNIELVNEMIKQKDNFIIKEGCLLKILGKNYPVCFKERDNYGFDGEAFCIPTNLNQNEIKFCLIETYKTIAKNIITTKVNEFSAIMNVNPRNIKINSAKTRWGSCSTKKDLNFTWKLIMASEKEVDYVIVHELAHIKEHNHSKQFWEIVGNIFPDYKKAKKNLVALHYELYKEGWNDL